uniref:Uncharacterized protein n=1 Tax=Anguilla anguilla TaxID=7936 RepID=A0A0E9QNU9_ANGAN
MMSSGKQERTVPLQMQYHHGLFNEWD